MCSRFCGVRMASPHVPSCTSSSYHGGGHRFLRFVFTRAKLGSREDNVQANARNVGVCFAIPGNLGPIKGSKASAQDSGPSPLFIQYLEPTPRDCAEGKRSETVRTEHVALPRCIQYEGEERDAVDYSDVPLSQLDDIEDDFLMEDEERPSESVSGHEGGSGFHGLEQEKIPAQEVVFKYTQSLRGLDEGLSEDGLEDFSSLENKIELEIGNAVDLEVDFLEELFPNSRGLLTGRKVFSVGRQSFQSLHETNRICDEQIPEEGELENAFMLENVGSDLENEASDWEDETSDLKDEMFDELSPVDKGDTPLHEVDEIVRLPLALGDYGVTEPRIANQQFADLSKNESWSLTHDLDMPREVGRGSSEKCKMDNLDGQQHVSRKDSGCAVPREGPPLSVSERLRLLSVKPTAPAASSVVEKLIQELLSVGKDITNSVYDVMESYSGKLSTLDANSVIERLADVRHFRQAFAVFEWMRSQDPILVNSRSYSLILPLLGTAGMMKQAMLIFQNMKADFRSIQTYNSYIGLLLSCGREDDLQPVLTDMESRGIKKDAVTFSLFINYAVKKKRGLKEVLRIYKTMTQNQVTPNTAVFGSVVKAFCDEGHLDDALVFVNEMETSGMPPNIIVYNTLIDAFGKARMLDVAEWLLSEVKRRGLRPHVSTYNALMNVYGRQGRFEVAEGLFTEMQDAGLKPDVVSYTTLINAYAKRKMSEKAANVFAKMRKAGIFPNVNAYTALIHAYSEDGWHTKGAMAFENMQREGISPTVQTYTALLEGYRVAGDIQQVIRIWREMKADGCKGTRITFNTLVDAFAKQGRYQEARDVVSEYAALGYRPDNMTYNMLINAYGRGGNHEKIPDLVKEMLKLGLKPDSFTFCTIVYAFLRVRDFKSAFRWFDKMLQRKQKPDPETYRKLADLVKQKRQIQQENDRKAVLGQIAAKELLLSGKAAPKPGGKKEFWKTKKPHKTSRLKLKSKPKQAAK